METQDLKEFEVHIGSLDKPVDHSAKVKKSSFGTGKSPRILRVDEEVRFDNWS